MNEQNDIVQRDIHKDISLILFLGINLFIRYRAKKSNGIATAINITIVSTLSVYSSS